VRVIQSPTRAMWAPPGYLLFLREGNLMAQPMNLKTFQVSGEPLAVAQDVAANEGNGRSTFAVSQNGVLVYRPLTDQMRQLTWRDREGKVLSEVGKPADLSGLSLSPDEKSAAYYVGAGGNSDVWVIDLASGASTRLTTDSKAFTLGPSPKWSPDSQRLAFAARGSGAFEITLASGKIASLSPEAVVPETWSPDGKSILCSDNEGRKVYLLRVSDRAKLETILDTPHRKAMFSFSPDGKYVAYVSVESGRQEIYVAAFPSFAVKKKVSDGGGQAPAWTKGGRELLYRSANALLMSAEIRTGATIESGIPKTLFAMGSNNARGYRFAPTADGQRILVSAEPKTIVPEVPQISVVLNWLAGVKE
jgi:eukaryotic-like serine/threonine-protein kinase